MDKQALIDQVINEMRTDFDSGDLTAIEELLNFIPEKYLLGYLPENVTASFNPPPTLALPKGAELEWDISTAHISENDSRLLDNLPNWAFTTDGGWSVGIDSIASHNPDLGEFSMAFNRIIEIAKYNGIASVRFDRDVSSLCDLKRFDW